MLPSIEKAVVFALLAAVLERPLTCACRRANLEAKRLRSRGDIYQLGYDRGYAEGHSEGYAEGRRVAKPVVIPPMRIGP